MIAIIDYDAGNIKSVEKAMIRLGQDVCITRDKERILTADKVILPGVGAFGDAMGKIHQYGLEPVIHEVGREERRFSESVLAYSSCLNEVMRHLEWKDLAF